MAPDNRPGSRKKNIGEGTGSVKRRGSGLDSTPIQSSGDSGGHRPGGGNVTRGGGISIGTIILIAIVYFVFFRGGSSEGYDASQPLDQNVSTQTGSQSVGTSSGDLFGGMSDVFGSLIGGYSTSPDDYSSYEDTTSQINTAQLDTNVSPMARQKYTSIIGQGADVVTIMVYLCGTDLESGSGMGTADLQEMASATLSDNVNLIVYTGGCSKWKNNVVSSNVNQIHQIKQGGVKTLEKDMGKKSMSDPNTLTEFIKYCGQNFPANRNELILWDHGSGSLSGFAYDEKYPQTGSMSLSGIKKAIDDSGMKFDFVGFDACLMATVETALMLSDYADYMIASEETEPGVGWYYTNWLTRLSADTSMPTAEIGKNIVDDFVDMCAKKCPGQKATLSVTDLSEAQMTVPEKLSSFSKNTSDLIADFNGYTKVSDARNKSKEFAVSHKLDQIDFIHFANLLDTPESHELADVLSSCVKYNRTERTIANANGLSVYFPYKKASKAGSMAKTYEQIGMDSAYTECIRAFAQNEQTGQSSPDGVETPIGLLLSSILGGRDFGEGVDKKLQPTDNGKGQKVIRLSEDEWKKNAMVDLAAFVDDGEGFIGLGYDNTFTFDENNDLIADFDGTWMSINGHIVAYYHTESMEDGDHYCYEGYVPVILNGERAELILVFSDQFPDGMITGARAYYENGETDTVAKSMIALKAGDVIDFVCRYYDYDGTYKDSYKFGEQLVLDSPDFDIKNIRISPEDGKALAAFKFTDIYHQESWSPFINDN